MHAIQECRAIHLVLLLDLLLLKQIFEILTVLISKKKPPLISRSEEAIEHFSWLL
jgi:hypothetical protein